MENVKSLKDAFQPDSVMMQDLKLGNKLAEKEEHNKPRGKSLTESHRKQLVWARIWKASP